MIIGKLRHRLTLQMVTLSSKNSYGERVQTLSDLGKVWGSVDQISGEESGSKSTATHKIVIRWRDNVEPKSKIIFDGRQFEAVSVSNRQERGRWLDILAREST